MQITDASGYAGQADQIFTPRSEEEIAEILARASSQGVPVTVMGALTGLAGGAVPKSGWAISMAQLRKLDVRPGSARAGTGLLLREVQAAAAASGQFYAPDPTEHFLPRGNHRRNASGSRSFRYGATRKHVRLRVVTWTDDR
jgi:FAD/FMN-containing dehydrogenase